LRLTVTTPTNVVVDREVTYVQAEDPSGRFGILAGHEPFLTALAPSILVYRCEEDGGEREAFLAVRRGVLRVEGDRVQVAAREAFEGSDLAALADEMRRARRSTAGREHRSTRSLYQMQLSAWRRLMEYEDVRVR
jgi:F-type H+-transporting ATPase subunit epsilon